MKMRITLFTSLMLLFALASAAQIELRTEAQLSVSDGTTPLWLNANKYGLSSLDKTNGYARVGAFRPLDTDSARRWGWSAGAEVAVAGGYTSTLIVQQAYAELRWLKGLLTVGSKEQPLQLKDQQLSSGSQSLGINARPVPSVRLELPEYWDIPGLNHWIGLKGHIAYGRETDYQYMAVLHQLFFFVITTSRTGVSLSCHTTPDWSRGRCTSSSACTPSCISGQPRYPRATGRWR